MKQRQGGGGPGGGADGRRGGRVPFARASYHYREKFFTDTITTSTSQQTQTPHNVTPGGFLRGIWIEVSGTGGSLGTPVLGSPSDFPFNIISSITLEDVNGGPIFGPLSGYELYLANKYGGYFNAPDPSTQVAFGGTFPSPYFVLWVPCEIRSDGLGSLANTDARAQYRLNYTIESETNMLSTGSVGSHITLTVTGWIDYWAQVEPSDQRGAPQEQTPPGLGTTQFWVHEIPTVAASAQTIKHNRVGNAIRTLVYILRNGVAASSSQPANQRVSNYTDPIRLRLDNRYLFSESPNLRRAIMSREFDLTGADGDPNPIGTPSDGFRETGVLVYPFSDDLGYKPSPGDESNWLDTNEAQFLQFEDTFNATVATMTILTNDVAPRGIVPMPSEIAGG